MTTDAPPAARPRSNPRGERAGQHGPVLWMALPALAVFLCFAVLPLIGVFALSFTRWDGLGPIRPAGFSNRDGGMVTYVIVPQS